MKKSTALDHAAAFRCINTTYELLVQAGKEIESARLLYPECHPKHYNKIYSLLTQLKYRVPSDTSTWEF